MLFGQSIRSGDEKGGPDFVGTAASWVMEFLICPLLVLRLSQLVAAATVPGHRLGHGMH
jgi:hypothetical protein